MGTMDGTKMMNASEISQETDRTKFRTSHPTEDLREQGVQARTHKRKWIFTYALPLDTTKHETTPFYSSAFYTNACFLGLQKVG
ncbi:MAG: hypothetical protein K9J17_03745 [Flavobacteriales bacterium]|nr:hypothetical protein [Flavobacteriales bacterium]